MHDVLGFFFTIWISREWGKKGVNTYVIHRNLQNKPPWWLKKKKKKKKQLRVLATDPDDGHCNRIVQLNDIKKKKKSTQ